MMTPLEVAIKDAYATGMKKSFEDCMQVCLDAYKDTKDEKHLKILDALRYDYEKRKNDPPHYFSYKRALIELLAEDEEQ